MKKQMHLFLSFGALLYQRFNMKFILSTIILLQFYTITNSQSQLEQRILFRVNNLRDSLQIPKLSLDLVLKEAAYDQAYYMFNKKNITHFQETFTKETPADRIYYFGGNRTYSGENVASIGSIQGMSENQIADSLFQLWFDSPEHFKNMINPFYTKLGIGVRIHNKKTLYAAQVFSSNEITLPKEFKQNALSWGVRTSQNDCRIQREVNEQLFFANQIEVVGNDIYFFYHDINFFNRIIKNDNDGMAVDVIVREQLPCNKENQFHISPIYDGEMQRPIYRNDLLKNDISFNPGKIRTKIGEVPLHLQNKSWEVSIIVINDNMRCDYNYPVCIPHDIYPLLPIEPLMDYNDEKSFISTKKIHIQDSIHIELDYSRSKHAYSDMNYFEFYRMLSLGDYIHGIQVDCFASVEGEEWLNMQLLESRKNSVQTLFNENDINANKINYTLAENWVMMDQQIKDYGLDLLAKKDKEGVRYYLKRNRDELIDSLLFEQRKTHIYATIDTTFEINSTQDYRIGFYYDSTLRMTELNWNKILREEYIVPDGTLPKFLIDSLKTEKKYRTNLLAALTVGSSRYFIDSASVEKLSATHSEGDVLQKFNFVHFMTNYWFVSYARSYSMKGVGRTIEPDQLLSLLKSIENQAPIEKWNLNRLRMNVLLSGIHYYVTHNNWAKANSYFNMIFEVVKRSEFTQEEALQLALFCNHFHRFQVAIKVLDLFFDEKTLEEDGVFALAQTATLVRSTLSPERYMEYMVAAKRMNTKRYCKWLNDHFQLLRDEDLKNDYCRTCK